MLICLVVFIPVNFLCIVILVTKSVVDFSYIVFDQYCKYSNFKLVPHLNYLL